MVADVLPPRGCMETLRRVAHIGEVLFVHSNKSKNCACQKEVDPRDVDLNVSTLQCAVTQVGSEPTRPYP